MYKCRIRPTLVIRQLHRKINDGVAGTIKAKITPKKRRSYSETILLPRTQFQVHIKGKERIEKDIFLTKNCGFSELYKWQRENLSGPDFILHDGPPYANGIPHMGHAINKILKDITLRHKIICRNKVHYVPGWDCHGLPVELKAIQNDAQDPLEIRRKARICAGQAVVEQKQAFLSWGVTADWSEPGCYFTNQTSYMKNQLQQFLKLYEKGIVFRDFMPVYWSPSSRTALAESELEYDEHHQSKAATVRLRVDSIPKRMDLFQNHQPVYALIWTTIPWSLVANQAIAFSADTMYCIAEDSEKNLNIVAEQLLKAVELKVGPLKALDHFKGIELEGSMYFHPFKEEKLPFLAGRHVTTNVGTGLVHTAPAHGTEDFLLAIENNIQILSVVDVEGQYTEAAGPELNGLKVLTDGINKVLDLVAQDVLHVEMLTHSYPYDWRTKQPVIMRASNQWFIDIDSVKEKIIDSLVDINIYPKCNRTSFTNALIAAFKNRPYWCISRQRSWGTPIPVLYSKRTGTAFTNRELVERLCHSIDRYGPDCWWQFSIEELIGVDMIEKLKVAEGDVEKGMDIMDIWFDSGISWSMVLPDGKANLYLEGHDQFRGWFQSSLITSVALQGRPPYSALFVHGFAVDKNNLKMSKSVGNVINPEELLLGGSNLEKNPVYGVDVLRWWVARHGSQHTQVPISKDLLDGCKQCVLKLRLILRFLLGALHPYHRGVHCQPDYRIADKYMLYLLYCYNEQMQKHYNNYEYHHAAKTIMHFIANDLSAFYCTVIKDRLYCDEVTSSARTAAVQVVNEISNVLVRTIAPILPHLAEEVWLHYPDHASEPLHCTQYKVSESWSDQSIVQCMDAALRLRKNVLKIADKTTWKLYGTIEATVEDFSSLCLLHPEKDSSTSELCEILQLSSVTLTKNCSIMETEIQVHENQKVLCQRCRRYSECREEDGLCARCINVLAVSEAVAATANVK